MSDRNVINMERQRLREPNERRELDADEVLAAVESLMHRYPRFEAAMNGILEETKITQGEILAINMGFDLHEALED